MQIASIEQLRQQVAHAAEQQLPLYPLGGNTQCDCLHPPLFDGVTIELNALNQLVDYPHQDMTITVQAGMTMKCLANTLAAHGQMLPLDVPQPELATVGGSLAANVNGPRRLGYGTWRDYVIGISWINDRGEEAKAGGRVVKNVAGYDFCKLFAGSLGTLGIITQVTLKVKPIPEKRVFVVQELQPSALPEAVEQLLKTKCKPVMAVLTSGSPLQLYQLFEDNTASVDWQFHEAQKTCPHLHLVNPTKLETLIDFPQQGKQVTLQVALPRSQSATFLQQQQSLLSEADAWQMQPLSGLLTVHLPECDTLGALNQVKAWRQTAALHHGLVTVPRCPATWRDNLLPWGEPRPDWQLMRTIKHALDPHQLFQRHRHEILRWDGNSPAL